MKWPIGVYAVKDGKVRFVPAVDVTWVLLAAIAAVAAVLTRSKMKFPLRTPTIAAT